MVGRKKDRVVEIDADLHFLPCCGPFTTGKLTGSLVDPVHDGIGDCETWTQNRSRETQRTRDAVSGRGSYFNIARRVVPYRHISGGRVRGVAGEDVIKLDLYLADTAYRRSRYDQASEGRACQRCRLAKNKVVGGLRLNSGAV